MDQKERRNYCQEIMNEALVNAELEDVVDLLKTLLLVCHASLCPAANSGLKRR